MCPVRCSIEVSRIDPSLMKDVVPALMKAGSGPSFGPLRGNLDTSLQGTKKERFRTPDAPDVKQFFSDVKHFLNGGVQNPSKCKPNVKQCNISF